MKWKIEFWRESSIAIWFVWRGRASGVSSQYREYVDTCCNLSELGTTRVHHRLPWCLHRGALDIGWYPARDDARQKGDNLQLGLLDTRTKNWHATRHDGGRYTPGNLHEMLLKLVCNTWSWYLQSEHWNTRSRRWHFVWRWEAAAVASVPSSAPRGCYAAVQRASSEEYCGSWTESAAPRPLHHSLLRASGGSSKIDCQLSNIQAALSCRQPTSRNVFHRTLWSTEPVYPLLWALT